eukprot:g14108.t1
MQRAAEEETRLATRELPSTFAREVPSCPWKTQGNRALAMVYTRKGLGLCDEQVDGELRCRSSSVPIYLGDVRATIAKGVRDDGTRTNAKRVQDNGSVRSAWNAAASI